jgi:DNA polymerase-3 subunit alpha
MKEYLEDTYGITVYQEQVMLLSQSIGGFSKGDADVLRKAMGKKQKSVLDKMKSQFIEGATAKGTCERNTRKDLDRLGSICAIRI